MSKRYDNQFILRDLHLFSKTQQAEEWVSSLTEYKYKWGSIVCIFKDIVHSWWSDLCEFLTKSLVDKETHGIKSFFFFHYSNEHENLERRELNLRSKGFRHGAEVGFWIRIDPLFPLLEVLCYGFRKSFKVGMRIS